MNMRKIKKSKYAFFVRKSDGSYIVYSPVSGSVIRIFEEKYIMLLEKLINQDMGEVEENELIQILIDKRILLDEYVNEDALVRGIYEEQIVKTDVLDVMLVVTRQCNFRCVYCGQSHLNVKMSAGHYDVILKFIEKQILTYRYKKVRITFFGGEPLLEIEKICLFLEKLKKLLYDLSSELNEIRYEAGMSTNGYLLTPSTFERLTKLNCDFYQISVDGMPLTHNKMRPLSSGTDTWKQITDNLEYMISTSNEFVVTLRTNYNVEVAESLVEFYRYVGENLNDKRINIYYETIKNQGNKDTPDTISGIKELVFGIDIAQLISENNLICNNATARLLPCGQACYAGKPSHFIFDEKLQLLKCSYDLDKIDNVIGKLEENGEWPLNFNKYCQWVYNDYLNFAKCRECKILPLCFGKRCPKNLIDAGEPSCNLEVLLAEIEGLLQGYY